MDNTLPRVQGHLLRAATGRMCWGRQPPQPCHRSPHERMLPPASQFCFTPMLPSTAVGTVEFRCGTEAPGNVVYGMLEGGVNIGWSGGLLGGCGLPLRSRIMITAPELPSCDAC